MSKLSSFLKYVTMRDNFNVKENTQFGITFNY